ncbi:MAG: chemotaxis-specific protein-glutamate methyltransferase CheB [Thermaerobacter sp.]|nr:chemotaxis-specific protein-glutamate methyltransferase CheB [Thermaerobacter sp.]
MWRAVVAEGVPASREYIVRLLRQDPDLEVVAAVGDGLEAVKQVQRLKPQVILMDIDLPRLDGIAATREIMRTAPAPIVMMSASETGDDAKRAFAATQAGALTFVVKPAGGAGEQERKLLEMVKAMAEVKVVRRWGRPEEPPRLAAPLARIARDVRVIAIGASTGGPHALMEVLQQLPADLGIPLLVVQHITPGFARGLAEWLDDATPFVVKLAEDGERIVSGTVYLAPDGVQMVVAAGNRIGLVPPYADQPFCPSVDRLFDSVAAAYGPAAVGVILTGMGRDGAQGLKRLREAGGVTIAQDEATSAVFGMPKEAIRLNAARYVLPIEHIGAAIRRNVLPQY